MKRLGLILLTLIFGSSLGLASTSGDLKVLVSKMQRAILTQDKSAYLELLDLSDPTFKVEHLGFIDDWMQNKVSQLELNVVLLDEEMDSAEGLLTWTYLNKDQDPITSSYRAVFHKIENQWLYAGEFWQRLQTENLNVLFMPGLADQAQQVLETLPDIITHVSNSLEFQSQRLTTIKIYDSRETITQSVGLSWTVFAGWNEPDEAIKVSSYFGGDISRSLLAHEITHNYAFERFGTGSFPWWLDEGLAEYVSSSFWIESRVNNKLNTVSNWALANMLEPWENISDLNTTPTQLWDFVYVQGFAFVHYLSSIYGQGTRNRWLSEISSGKSLTEAAQITFSASFEQVNQDFRTWLKQRVATSSLATYFNSFGTSFIQRFSPSPVAHCAITTASLGFNWALETFPTLGLPPQTL